MRVFDWLFRRPGSRKSYRYSTVIKFVYMLNEKTWWCTVPGASHEGLTVDHLIKSALSELRNCRPLGRDACECGHVWPGGSNIRYMVEFVFDGRVFRDGFIGWEVSFTHPNENGHVSNGGRFKYGRAYEGAIEAFLRHELENAEMAILSKILSRE